MDTGSRHVSTLPAKVAQIPSDLVAAVYDELRVLARQALGKWRTGQTLEATALVHEAWLRMGPQHCFASLGRETFLALAALSIRRILVEHHRARRAQRRGGDAKRVPLFESILLEAGPTIDLLALDEALEALALIEPRQAQVVELRFFGGLSEPEAAAALGVSLKTISDDWRFARAWLARRLRGGAST